ncbi:MAG TPA: rhomboid family intramembrane serine protease [Polyangiales bacterium]
MIPLRDINPTRRAPYVSYALIALNLAVFAYQFLSLSPLENSLFVRRHGVVPLFLFSGYAPSLSTLLSSMFMHGGLLHLVSNMWFLHIFGDNVEDAMGHLRYAAFYVCSGVAAALVHAFTDPGSGLPMVGASGAISGVLGAYLMMFPRARVVTLVFVFLLELPAILFILFWFGIQLFSGFGALSSQQGAGVAFFAHVGGFVAGVVWIVVFGRPPQKPHAYLGPRIGTRGLRRF